MGLSSAAAKALVAYQQVQALLTSPIFMGCQNNASYRCDAYLVFVCLSNRDVFSSVNIYPENLERPST
jgi:hypothetical protein